MDEKRDLLRHMLAALAYRTAKALRGTPDGFGDFRPAPDVRNPRELVRHMTSVLGYARTFFVGGEFRPTPLDTLGEEVDRFHGILKSLSDHFATSAFASVSPEQLLQGPLCDAMSHAGQLAALRRLFGSPVPPENFVFAGVSVDNLTADQPEPAAPDEEWHTPAGDQAWTEPRP